MPSPSSSRLSDRATGWAGRAAGRLRAAAWRITLAAITAGAAWWLAQVVLGQPSPIFAPIAAVVCLTDTAAVRGRRAVRLLAGVCVGVVVGELSGLVVGSGWLQVGAAVAVGMLVVSLGSISSLTLLQSGIAALLVVGLASPQTGWTRLASAAIGGALALVVSQVLASPSPVRILLDAAGRGLRPAVAALEGTAAALREGSDARARASMEGLREGQDELATFLDACGSADAIARSTLRGRRERDRVRSLQERFAGVEYVHAGAVLLARTTSELVAAGARVPEHLVSGIDDLAAALRAVADHPDAGDPRPDDAEGADHDGLPRRSRTHEVADEIAAADLGDHHECAARLATQLHLLAVDIAGLTEPAESGTTTSAARRAQSGASRRPQRGISS